MSHTAIKNKPTNKYIHETKIQMYITNHKHSRVRTNSNIFTDLFINNIKIIPTSSSKYLGLHFDDKLNFDKHINITSQNTSDF